MQTKGPPPVESLSLHSPRNERRNGQQKENGIYTVCASYQVPGTGSLQYGSNSLVSVIHLFAFRSGFVNPLPSPFKDQWCSARGETSCSRVSVSPPKKTIVGGSCGHRLSKAVSLRSVLHEFLPRLYSSLPLRLSNTICNLPNVPPRYLSLIHI